MTQINRDEIHNALLAWYQKACREMPWRAKPDAKGKRPSKLKDANPYHVLVSEAMLQQTQVATVIDYFNRFIETFPTIQDLAAADESDVMHLWQGLGYYRRARHLHKAAQYVVNELDGDMPQAADELKNLPGVGPYTAGAISSIAFGERSPLVDGNVIRVLSRLAMLKVAANDAGKMVWALAQDLLPEPDTSRAKRNPIGDFNQALMELGATICHARDPKCMVCPLKENCQALISGKVQDYPLPAVRKAPRNAVHHVMVLTRTSGKKKQVYVNQRGKTGLWSGMWELPAVEYVLGKGAAFKELDDWGGWESIAAKAKLEKGQEALRSDMLESHLPKATCLKQFKHQTTHRSIVFVIWQMEMDAAIKRKMKSVMPDGEWVEMVEAEAKPMSNPQRKVLGILSRLGML